MAHKKDITGERFGRLVALKDVGITPWREHKWECLVWKCKCSCGNYKEVASHQLLSGKVTTCGCYGLKDLLGKVFGRLNHDNGVTLCKKCHEQFHTQFGNIDFTINDYIVFLKNKEI